MRARQCPVMWEAGQLLRQILTIFKVGGKENIGTNISHPKALWKMIFPFPVWWDMYIFIYIYIRSLEGVPSESKPPISGSFSVKGGSFSSAGHGFECWRGGALKMAWFLWSFCASKDMPQTSFNSCYIHPRNLT